MDSSLEAVVKMIREDGSIKALTESYRMTKDMALKEASPLFGVAAVFRNGKRKEDICQLTGLSLVDVDHVAAKGGVDSLKLKVERDPHTLVCYRTISGEGLRILFRYELDGSFTLTQQMQFYPKAFTVGNAYYAKLLGVETDGKCKNIGRLSGLAFDPEVFINWDAVAFTKTEIEAHNDQEVQRRREAKQLLREKNRLQMTYERDIQPEVVADGAVYAAGSHNDYVMRVGYKLNQLGFTEDMAVAWAVELFADYDKTEEVIHACYQRTEEFGTRKHKGTPRREKRTEGSSFASVQEIQAFLSEHIRLRHNVITGRVECKLKVES